MVAFLREQRRWVTKEGWRRTGKPWLFLGCATAPDPTKRDTLKSLCPTRRH